MLGGHGSSGTSSLTASSFKTDPVSMNKLKGFNKFKANNSNYDGIVGGGIQRPSKLYCVAHAVGSDGAEFNWRKNDKLYGHMAQYQASDNVRRLLDATG